MVVSEPSRCSVLLQIADRGVRALVKALDSNNVVTFLNLEDNQVSMPLRLLCGALLTMSKRTVGRLLCHCSCDGLLCTMGWWQ